MGVQEDKDYSGEVICLKCRKKFQSKDRRCNRLCKKCTNANNSIRTGLIVTVAGVYVEDTNSED